ncbi:MAG: hypothetical protein L0Y35_02765 [Flammeovirgaceae bacterium]|nr:hypothetical protein [Flammeovirgaceae bacterium]
MNTAVIREKLHHYIETAKDKKVKAIFAMVEEEIEKSEGIWTDDFLKELNRRKSDFETGNTPGRSWHEVKKTAKKSLRSKSA